MDDQAGKKVRGTSGEAQGHAAAGHSGYKVAPQGGDTRRAAMSNASGDDAASEPGEVDGPATATENPWSREMADCLQLLAAGDEAGLREAAKRLTALAAEILRQLEARNTKAAARPAVPLTPPAAPAAAARGSAVSVRDVREALTRAIHERTSEPKIALAAAIVAWYRAQACGSRVLLADAAPVLGSALLRLGYAGFARWLFELTLQLGGSAPFADVAKAERSGRRPLPSLTPELRQAADAGRAMLLRQAATREWGELEAGTWSSVVEKLASPEAVA
jgi:hypothetical protein